MNPDLLQLDASGKADVISPAADAAMPDKITGFIPVVTSITPLSSAAQFLE